MWNLNHGQCLSGWVNMMAERRARGVLSKLNGIINNFWGVEKSGRAWKGSMKSKMSNS